MPKKMMDKSAEAVETEDQYSLVKNVVVFCTYKLAIGSTLRQMAEALEEEGAIVVEQFKYRGSEPNSKFASFANSLT